MDCPNGCGMICSTNYRDVLIEVCAVCVGVWLDPDELDDIATQPTQTWPKAAMEEVLAKIGKPGVPADHPVRSIHCPQCKQALQPTNYEGASGIIINACPADHGYWLEGGEMIQLQIYSAYMQNILGNLSHKKTSNSDSASGSQTAEGHFR